MDRVLLMKSHAPYRAAGYRCRYRRSSSESELAPSRHERDDLYELVRTILPSRQSLRAAMRTLDFAGRAGTGLRQPAFQRTAAGRAAHVVGLAGAASAAARTRWHRPAPDTRPARERLRTDPGRARVATAGGKHGYLGSSLGTQ